MDVSNRALLRADGADKAGGASRLKDGGLWVFDSRAGVCEVGRPEQGWAPGMQVFGRVVDVMGLGHNQELTIDLQGYCRE